jgi:HEAT repeats
MRTANWTLLVLLLTVLPARAGLFNRKPKPTPPQNQAQAMQKQAERVYGLLNTLQNDTKAGKRADAAEDLQNIDGGEFPEIVPALIQAALRDSESDVRKEAVKSLGRIKPTSAEAAQALEQATKDESYSVRRQARSAKHGYKVAEAPPSAPASSQMIKIPPAGADGRLTPVPLPGPETSSGSPPATEEVQKAGKVSLSKPTPKPPQDGPILVPPIR